MTGTTSWVLFWATGGPTGVAAELETAAGAMARGTGEAMGTFFGIALFLTTFSVTMVPSSSSLLTS